MGIALLRVVKHPVDVRFGHHVAPGRRHGLAQPLVLLHVEFEMRRPLRIRGLAGLEHGIQPLRTNLGTGHHGGDLLLFDDFPINELFDVGMVEIQADHLGRAPRRPA